jgi:chorismate mutase
LKRYQNRPNEWDDLVDGNIFDLLNERAEIALDVARVKAEGGMDFYDPQREAQILERLTSGNGGRLPQAALRSRGISQDARARSRRGADNPSLQRKKPRRRHDCRDGDACTIDIVMSH